MKLTNRTRNVAVGILVMFGLAACGTGYDTDSDKQAVQVESYTIKKSDTKVKDCKSSNKAGYGGHGDKFYYYPEGQRTFDANKDADAEAPPVSILFGSVNMQVPLTVTFYMTSDCTLLKKFHKEIGAKAWAKDGTPAYIRCGNCSDDHYDGDKVNQTGWIAMLQKYIGKPAIRAATDAAVLTESSSLGKDNKPLSISAVTLLSGQDRAAYEKKVQELLPGYVKSLAGEDYFTDFTVQVSTPVAPSEFTGALLQRETAKQLNLAQTEKNAAVQTELQSIRSLVEVLGQKGYTDYQHNKLTDRQNDLLEQALKDGRIKVLPVSIGSATIVPGE